MRYSRFLNKMKIRIGEGGGYLALRANISEIYETGGVCRDKI
jgi:hypothetical protein